MLLRDGSARQLLLFGFCLCLQGRVAAAGGGGGGGGGLGAADGGDSGPALAYPCTWTNPDAKDASQASYDLTGLIKTVADKSVTDTDYTFTSGPNKLWLSPCQAAQTQVCGGNSALCMQWDPTRPNGEASLGSVTTAKILGQTTDQQKSSGGFTYEFTKGTESVTNGQARQFQLEFVCDAGAAAKGGKMEPGKPTYGGESPTLHYTVTWVTPYACPVQNKLSGGSIALIVLASVIVLYFVGGALFMKFVKHAEGIQIIPNVEFWSAIPGLVKDGCLFIGQKTCCRGGSGYSTV